MQINSCSKLYLHKRINVLVYWCTAVRIPVRIPVLYQYYTSTIPMSYVTGIWVYLGIFSTPTARRPPTNIVVARRPPTNTRKCLPHQRHLPAAYGRRSPTWFERARSDRPLESSRILRGPSPTLDRHRSSSKKRASGQLPRQSRYIPFTRTCRSSSSTR